MDEAIKLKHRYTDYDFKVVDFNLLDPEDSPCIALRRIDDDLVIAYSNFSGYVGTRPGDSTHMARLETVARMLSHFLANMENCTYARLSDIPLDKFGEYIYIMCSDDEAVYAYDFIYNLAKAGYLTYIKPEDITFTKELS